MVDNLFDGAQTAASKVVSNTMGYDAVWVPSDGSHNAGYTARVLFKNPTENKELAGVNYDPDHYQMEYFEGEFPGLKTLVKANNGGEIVVIKSVGYNIQNVDTKHDGKTIIADLYPV